MHLTLAEPTLHLAHLFQVPGCRHTQVCLGSEMMRANVSLRDSTVPARGKFQEETRQAGRGAGTQEGAGTCRGCQVETGRELHPRQREGPHDTELTQGCVRDAHRSLETPSQDKPPP